MLAEFRYALRKLARQPGFLAIAVLTLSLGIGATTTVFCWMQRVLLRPFPGVERQEQLVVLCSVRSGAQSDGVSLPNLEDLGTLSNVFAGVMGSQITPACLEVEGRPQWIYGQIATANFFDVLGVRPQLGRLFLPEEGRGQASAPVLVLSHGLWQQVFGGDPGVVGRQVTLNRHAFTVVGVTPPAFRGTMSGLVCDFWAPLVMHQEVAQFGSLTERSDSWLHTLGRLRPGLTRVQAQSAVDTRMAQLTEAYPATNRELGVRVLPTARSPWGGQAYFLPVLTLLLGVAIGVLLIVSVNLSNLLLARAATRRKEMAIRLAVGAGRWRLLRQLMVENLVLAALGGLGGVLVAHWGAGLLLGLFPTTYLPVAYDFKVDGLTLLFTAGLALASTILFGAAPAFHATGASLQDTLKEGGRTDDPGSGRFGLRGALVISEVALALLLLVGAGLCVQGFRRAQGVDPGFDPRHSMLAGMRLGAHGYTEAAGKVFYRRLQEEVRAMPGVESAALASWFPLGFEGGPGLGVLPEGYQPRPGEDRGAGYSIVSPGYFDTMRIPLLEGRDFDFKDDETVPLVAIVNEAAARKFWPEGSPVGRKFTYFRGRTATVIGVAKTGKYRSLSEQPARPFVYLPYLQGVWDLNLGIVARATAAPESLGPGLRRAVHAVDPAVEVWALIAYPVFMQAAFVAQRVAATLLVVLGVVAVVLAAMGIYGVMACGVAQRTHEIGVRMALGAGVRQVAGMILSQGLRLAVLGILCGAAGAVVLTRTMEAFLFGVSPLDPVTYGGGALLLLGVAAGACLVPALRAARVDPMVALRRD